MSPRWHNDGDECTGPDCGNPAHFAPHYWVGNRGVATGGNIPPKGSAARDLAEAAVHVRRIGRTLVHVPFVGPAPLGLLAGGVYRTFVRLGYAWLAVMLVVFVYLWLSGRI